ncbi:aminotransferase [Curvivirga aplysinae]|uniref:aminotransferase n=1 Tax=Curvivirga aplysinae TaxID=2529852 RepID=UPI0012BC271C|nr:aminotransferase [Curvivirga aplysinae]MTI10477.1 aminotransferase [Curvivirga aplysinae]
MSVETNEILSSYGTTVFEVMSRLAIENEAVNLGQGFPDEDGPEDIRQIAAEGLVSGPNQYPPMMGHPDLRQAVAEHNLRFYGLEINWQKEVLVTSGATEALADCCLALLNPGDEVILIEPLYDCYLPLVERAGATPIPIRITPPEWKLDRDALEAAFSDKTKFILLNSPMNPAGKVFNENDLSFIASLVIKHDCIALCDEVYEHIFFEKHQHKPLMTFEGMRDRCIRIGSAGKSFSLTGWKVGYITAPEMLLATITKSHQFLTFTTPPNLQIAVAAGLRKDVSYFNDLAIEMQQKRDYLKAGLEKLGFSVIECEGTYFLTVDISSMSSGMNDVDFCKDMTVNGGVAAVPVSAFYKNDAPDHFIRCCFCKKYDVLEEALRRLARYLNKHEDQVIEAAKAHERS